jgi:aspartate aminotransferase-like enzyme
MPRDGFSRKRLILVGETDWPARELNVERRTWNVPSVIPHDKLFTPGPVEVSKKTLAAFARPMIGHRGEAFKRLYREIHPGLQTLFGTEQPVFLSTSSAWGVMEGAIRNLVGQRVLCCMCGAFSDKWLEVARRCGKEAEPLQVRWGSAIDHKAIDAKLRRTFDTVTLIHNETTGG